jgi:hypothetical protein
MMEMPNIWCFLPTKYEEKKQMETVRFQIPISGKDLKSPKSPLEEKPASDPLPKITHAKSEQKAHSAQRRCSKAAKKMSPDLSQQYVTTELKKKTFSTQWGKSLINHIKDKFRHSTGLPKQESQRKFSSAADGLLIKEPEIPKQEVHTVASLAHGLGKVLSASDTHKKQQLLFTIHQCFGLADGEPTIKNLNELLQLVPELQKHAESFRASRQLEQKINEIFEKQIEAIDKSAKNMVMVDKLVVTSAPEHIPTPELQTLTNAEIIEHELGSIEKGLEEAIFNASGKASADDITNELDSILKELSEDIQTSTVHTDTNDFINQMESLLNEDVHQSPTTSKTNISADPIDALIKEIDESSTNLEHRGVSIKKNPKQPTPAVPLPAEDDLDRLRKELNDKS